MKRLAILYWLILFNAVATTARHCDANEPAAGESVANVRGAEEPPVIPVGLDALRQWERWPYQRIGARAYMRSTYDRSGGNEGADASHFLYQTADDFNVALDIEGPGVLYFARYNHWHGSPWHYEVDHIDHIVQETTTATPTKPVAGSVFLPVEAFPKALAPTWSETRGADLMWAPIPFEQSFRMAYSRTHYGTGYYIYRQYVRGARLSRSIRSWDAKTAPDEDVVRSIHRAGTELAPDPAGYGNREVEAVSGQRPLDAQAAILARITHAPSMLQALEFSVPRESAILFGRARLRITWDDRPQPSIDAPIALFFGAGTLYNRDGREYLVKAFPVHIRFDERRVYLACYFPMPFFRSARIELRNTEPMNLLDVKWSVRYTPYHDPPEHVG